MTDKGNPKVFTNHKGEYICNGMIINEAGTKVGLDHSDRIGPGQFEMPSPGQSGSDQFGSTLSDPVGLLYLLIEVNIITLRTQCYEQ